MSEPLVDATALPALLARREREQAGLATCLAALTKAGEAFWRMALPAAGDMRVRPGFSSRYALAWNVVLDRRVEPRSIALDADSPQEAWECLATRGVLSTELVDDPLRRFRCQGGCNDSGEVETTYGLQVCTLCDGKVVGSHPYRLGDLLAFCARLPEALAAEAMIREAIAKNVSRADRLASRGPVVWHTLSPREARLANEYAARVGVAAGKDLARLVEMGYAWYGYWPGGGFPRRTGLVLGCPSVVEDETR